MFKTLFYTASAIIVSEGKVLLHMHARFHTWLQVGGHIERNESPHQAVVREVREVREEAGIDVSLFHNQPPLVFPKLATVIRPMHIRLIDTELGFQFLDFLYYAAIPQCVSIQKANSQFRWFTPNELKVNTSIKPDVCYFGSEAISLISVK